jgi:hypothetical protein
VPRISQLIKSIAHAWDRFWFARFDPLSVGMFRIFTGLLMTVMFLCLYPNWERYYGIDGVLSMGNALSHRPFEDWWCIFNYTEPYFSIQVWWWISLFTVLCFTVGFKTRWATILLYIIQVSIIHRNRFAINGEDLVFRMLLFYACFAPLGHSLSVDSWLHKPKTLPMIWPVRLMQLNFLLIYVISLPNKLVDDMAWHNGQAVYYSFVSNLWARGIGTSLFYGGFLSKMATFGTILVEGLSPILIWFRKTRIPAILALASLHIGIALFLQNVAFFSLAMVCALWIFVPVETLKLIPWPAKLKRFL